MCGITGFLSRSRSDEPLDVVVRRMSDTLTHRGPDASGVWSDSAAGVALGHRRLSILDLSEHGSQPMHSACGKLTVVYNGEIYNFRQLRDELAAKGHKFRGSCDTEVLLAAVAEWGVERAVEQFIGMFAFAVWDHEHRRFTLVRDRLGIKPLYYGWQGNSFLFGSELKSLRAHPDFDAAIHRDALALFLRHNYLPCPYSIYENVFKLPPGTLLTINADSSDKRPGPKSYWSIAEVAQRGESNPFDGSRDDAIEALDAQLREAVDCRMIADVPLGAFLSGGIDSSVVVAMMQSQSSSPIKTFSIGFDEPAFNEAKYAGAVAKHLGTDHTEWYVSSKDACDVIPKLPEMFDEPFSDSSQIPTYLVSQLARQHVTVSLSGDGGDELFAGYNRYYTAPERWRSISWCPAPIRSLVGWTAKSIGRCQPFRVIRRKSHNLAENISVPNKIGMYARIISHWKSPADVVIGASALPTIFDQCDRWQAPNEFLHQMMLIDAQSYLSDDILTKVDRASMAVSLESRVPLLDHRVVELAWSMPLDVKYRDGQSKWVLRQVLDRYVPRKLIDRPKVGFGVPIDSWLRGPLRDWAESLLNPSRLANEGFFNPDPIQQKWQQHLTGQIDWHYHLWDVLMFQAWLEQKS